MFLEGVRLSCSALAAWLVLSTYLVDGGVLCSRTGAGDAVKFDALLIHVLISAKPAKVAAESR